MLVVLQDTPLGRAGTLLSALIIVCAAIGLTLHRDFYSGIRRRDFFYYYTNVSNLIVLVYFALIAPRLYAAPALRSVIAHAEFAVTACIMLTFCVFHLLLLPGLIAALRASLQQNGLHVRLFPLILAAMHDAESAILLCDNLLIHSVVPLLTLLFWLFCAPDKPSLSAADAAAWLMIPGIYLAAVLLRSRRGTPLAGTISPYPYPFLDIQAYGFPRTAKSCAAVLAASLIASLLAVALARTGILPACQF